MYSSYSLNLSSPKFISLSQQDKEQILSLPYLEDSKDSWRMFTASNLVNLNLSAQALDYILDEIYQEAVNL